jgi:hypothetical protein
MLLNILTVPQEQVCDKQKEVMGNPTSLNNEGQEIPYQHCIRLLFETNIITAV